MAQAVIFDLDGTLADSELAHERALRAAAEIRGMTFTPEYFRARCVGLGEAGCFRMLAEEHGIAMDDALLAELIAAKLERFTEAVGGGGVAPHPGAVELVERVAGAGLPIAVCSGSSRGSVGPMLAAIGLADRFEIVVTSNDVTHHKPHPEGYLLTAARLGMAPAACVAIEDSPTGIAAAVASGMPVIAVEHSFPRDRLPGATAFARSIGDLTTDTLRRA